MRKWVMAATVLAVVAMSAALVGKDEMLTVDGVRLQPQHAVQTVSCSGQVAAGDLLSVAPDIACVIGEVMVEKGQAVHAGEAVVKINKEATRLMQQGRDEQALSLSVMSDTLYAEAAGIIVEVTAQAGSSVEAGEPCVVIARQDGLCVRVAIPEKHLNAVKADQEVQVSGKGLSKTSYAGVLEEIAASVSSSENGASVMGRVRLADDVIDSSFRLGLSTKVKITTAEYEDGLVVPFAALMREGDNAYVYYASGTSLQKRSVHIMAEVAHGALIEDTSLRGAVIAADVSSLPEDLSDVRVVVKEGEP